MDRKVIRSIRNINNEIKNAFDDGNMFHRNINFTQFQIIMYLHNHPNEEVCQKDLELETKINKASVTTSLDSLEDKDIIKRNKSHTDKRRNIISLTDKAWNIHKEMERKSDELEKQAVRDIDRNDLEKFFDVMDKITENLSRRKK